MTTTWNALCVVLENIEGNFDGFIPVEEDFEVALKPLFPGWLEVCREDGDTLYFLPDSRPTSLGDWIPREERPENFFDREGIALPEKVREYLPE